MEEMNILQKLNYRNCLLFIFIHLLLFFSILSGFKYYRFLFTDNILIPGTVIEFNNSRFLTTIKYSYEINNKINIANDKVTMTWDKSNSGINILVQKKEPQKSCIFEIFNQNIFSWTAIIIIMSIFISYIYLGLLGKLSTDKQKTFNFQIIYK